MMAAPSWRSVYTVANSGDAPPIRSGHARSAPDPSTLTTVRTPGIRSRAGTSPSRPSSVISTTPWESFTMYSTSSALDMLEIDTATAPAFWHA